jgi:predicted CXXCH cytochrome family protein
MPGSSSIDGGERHIGAIGPAPSGRRGLWRRWRRRGIKVACVFIAFALLGQSAAPSPPSPPVKPVAPVALPKATAKKPTTKVETCLDAGCHAAQISHKVMHGPVVQDKCVSCHEYLDPLEHRFKPLKDDAKLCRSCHTMTLRTVVHKPVEQGNCTGCHDPHGSDYRMLLVSDPTQGLCVKCHEQAPFLKKDFKHGPVAAGACIVCHEPHSAWWPKLLVRKPSELCVGCHSEVVKSKSDQPMHLHQPVKEDCTKCHDAHAGPTKALLVKDAVDLCLSCHEKVAKELKDSAVVHGVMTMANGCLGCHTPHRSALPKLQRVEQAQMCLSCHNKEIKVAGRTLPNMAELLADNPSHHGPIRTGDCTACHRPHAANQHNLLAKEYPPDFYAPYAREQYDLCFSCHQPQMVEDKHGVGVTRFRKGDVNLHWLHVDRQKGRTCRACHEVHASANPFHIRDAVPFGSTGWMLKIKYVKTDTGGSCAPGCHKPATYDYGAGAPAPPPPRETAEPSPLATPAPRATGGEP